MSLSTTEFARKWSGSRRSERAAAQEHFIDLCHVVGTPTPNEADPTGSWYAFEKGADKVGGGGGFADVWKRGHFAWEYKGKEKDLGAAYKQLLQYREALESPPLLVVCDLNRFQIHTNFTNTPTTIHEFDLRDIATDPREPLRLLRAVMEEPEDLRPGQTRVELTAQAAERFASLADRLRARHDDPHDVAHFLNKLLFCMFAEDARLLPAGLMGRLLTAAHDDPAALTNGLNQLFTTMATKGGLFGAERIAWFNGGLFDGSGALPLEREEIGVVAEVAALDWSEVEPAVFGTLFERGLDPDKRSQLGAHYTDRESILRIVKPVVLDPLRRDLQETQTQIESLLADSSGTGAARRRQRPLRLFNAFLDRLRSVRVLDPACGSGNFLYLVLQELKDLEHEAIVWGSLTLGTSMEFPRIGPEAVLGIELNAYAAELTRVVIWIGEIQWMLQNGFGYERNPVLRPLHNIQCRDAILTRLDTGAFEEPEWPAATAIVGNPPFLGGKLLRSVLGDAYVDGLFQTYGDRVPREADLVCYWHEKARAMIEEGRAGRVGLLATQGIRGGANRRILDRVKATGDIFLAWSDEPWILDGANVHVSLVAYDNGSESLRELNGEFVGSINANLTSGVDVTRACRLSENRGIAFMGDTKGGPFDVSEAVASQLLGSPNPDGRSNTDVVRPWVNSLDVMRRPRGLWIIDFGTMPEQEAALYEAPFEYVRRSVQPIRRENRRAGYATKWWQHVEARAGMRAALSDLDRFLVTPTVSKHRVFTWIDARTLADHQLIVFARSDDFFFGVLQSAPHELWARAQGTQLREVESGFRYTPTTTFETFPFPAPTPNQLSAISDAAVELDQLRRGWLSAAGSITNATASTKRTLTALYNERPAWLEMAHERLDRAVHAAYGWSHPLTAPEILDRLQHLNAARSQQNLYESLRDRASSVARTSKHTETSHAASTGDRRTIAD